MLNLKLTLAPLLVASVALIPKPALAEPTEISLKIPALRMSQPMPPGLLFADPASGAEPVTAVETTIFGLPKNMGTVDRVLRGVVAVTLASLGAYGLAGGNFSTAASGTLLGVSLIPATTGATGYCPLYHAFGIDTN